MAVETHIVYYVSEGFISETLRLKSEAQPLFILTVDWFNLAWNV